MPLPDPDILPALRISAFRQLETAAASDPSAAVRKRCTEILGLMRGASRKQLLIDQAAIATNTSATDADRLRAIDVIFLLIR